MAAVFTVEGIAPEREWQWAIAGEDVHRAFWRAVVGFVLEAKDSSLAKGLDRHGRPLVPVSERTRRNRHSAMGPADKNAPPLTPAHGLSRTRAFLAGRAYPDRAEFFWRNGWGKILEYHRIGAGHLPIRDVIGLSYADLIKVQRLSRGWWVNWQRTRRIEEQAEALTFEPPAAKKVQPAPFKPAAVPPPPRKIPVLGRTDFENATFGVGPGSGIERARAALEAGYHTGFRQFRLPPRPPKPRGVPALPRVAPNRPGLKRVAARKAN